MGKNEKHIINRVNASVDCGKQQLNFVQGLEWSSFISEGFAEIEPLLDAEFGKETVRLEELTITLDVDTNQLQDLSKLFKKSLREALSNIEKEDRAESKISYKKSAKLEPEEVFLYFLKNGKLPWFAAHLEYREAYFSKPDFQKNCLAVLKASSTARERLIQQLTKEELVSVLKALYPSTFINDLYKFAHFVNGNVQSYSQRHAAGFRLSQSLFLAGLEYLQKETTSYNLNDFLTHHRHEITAKIEEECNGRHLSFLKLIQQELANAYEVKVDFDKRRAKVLESTKESDIPSVQNNAEAWAEVDEEEQQQQLAVNAGIVLLHPFVKRFFNKVGLLENDKFISVSHQQRGICLLHNLATGERTFPEEKLAFYKFLCHYPQEHSIPKELPISDFELDEVENVLRSAISHWSALKRTSIAGLRANFLQRKGLLEEDAMGYTLHIENQTADILLDQLPWGLSALHWPWLPHLLTIKWR